MTEIDRNTQLANCNTVKALLMLLIVLGHSMSLWLPEGWLMAPLSTAPVLGMIAKWLGTFHTYAFAFVSGYIFFYVRFERSGGGTTRFSLW